MWKIGNVTKCLRKETRCILGKVTKCVRKNIKCKKMWQQNENYQSGLPQARFSNDHKSELKASPKWPSIDFAWFDLIWFDLVWFWLADITRTFGRLGLAGWKNLEGQPHFHQNHHHCDIVDRPTQLFAFGIYLFDMYKSTKDAAVQCDIQ